MTERPILFSAPMVRAIRSGAKTQTRRVVKARKDPDYGCHMSPGEIAGDENAERLCPYGQHGDRLWVRESFMHEPADYCWAASVSIPFKPASTVYRADYSDDTRGAGWQPSIHMPRSLSRITLEVTGVRVERLQAISEADAQAEGIVSRRIGTGDARTGCRDAFGTDDDNNAWAVNARQAFQHLWEQINGPAAWDANPWVWVVQFRSLPNAAAAGMTLQACVEHRCRAKR